MAGIKSLAKETAIYGLSSIVGRFLNWCLVPLYVYIFPAQEYGIVSYLYSFTAVALVILNYGMETGFFRFANKEGADPDKVYTTALCSVGFTSALFIFLMMLFITPLSKGMLLADHPAYIIMLGVTVAVDAFSNLPFAWLRFKKRAFRFATIKLANVAINIGLNIFFLLVCPAIWKSSPGLISWFYAPAGGEAFGIGWIFVANILSTLLILLLLLPEILEPRYTFSGPLLRRMLTYSWPLLILGVAGIASQNMGQLIIPYLMKGHELEAQRMVGIYGANIKIAIVMVMFTQAFRYAYEPFIFAQAKAQGEDRKQAYASAMKFFVIFGMVIFLGVMSYLPILRHFVSPGYWEGLRVVPVMMVAELFFGVFFNLSVWYKLTDRTMWGMWFSLLGLIVIVVMNVVLVPLYGYMGSAWAALICYGVMMMTSYYVGQAKYPIHYEAGKLIFYFFAALSVYGISVVITTGNEWIDMAVRTPLLILYIHFVLRNEHLNPLAIIKRHR